MFPQVVTLKDLNILCNTEACNAQYQLNNSHELFTTPSVFAIAPDRALSPGELLETFQSGEFPPTSVSFS